MFLPLLTLWIPTTLGKSPWVHANGQELEIPAERWKQGDFCQPPYSCFRIDEERVCHFRWHVFFVRSQETHPRAEISMPEVSRGNTLGTIPLRGLGKQDWAEEVHCSELATEASADKLEGLGLCTHINEWVIGHRLFSERGHDLRWHSSFDVDGEHQMATDYWESD